MGKKGEKDSDAGSSHGSGSSLGSGVSQSAEAAAEQAAAANEGQEEADRLLQSKTGVIQPIFGVLYSTLSSEKYDHLLRFAAVRVVADFVQLLLLVLRPDYGFQINTDLWVWHAIKWVEFANPLTSDGYKFYVAWIYVGVALILVSLSVALWVCWCFRRNHFPVIWPVQLLRMAVNAGVFVFFISCFTVFLAGFNCNWFMGGQIDLEGDGELVDLRFRMNRFPEIKCLEPPHLAHGIVAFAFCCIFTLIAYAVTLTDYEPNPASRRWLATPHSSVEVWAITAKTIMALNMAIFAGQLYIQSVIMCLCTLYLCYLYIRWQPHYNEWVNHFRSGLYTALFWTSVFMAILKFDHRREDPGHKKWLTHIMLKGLGPVLVFGALVSLARLRIGLHHIYKTIRNAPEGTRTKDLYWFSSPEEVEIASRVLRKWVPEDDEVLDPEAVKMAELIIQIGLAHFPDHPKMVLTYANFLICIQQNYQMGPSLLAHVQKLEEATLADRFITFAMEQEHKARSKLSQAGVTLTDLVAYVEYQRNFRLLARAHRNSLMTLKTFWTSLLHDDVSFKRCLDNFARIETTSKKTDKIFKVLLDKYPNDEALFRMYARFLEHVRSDPWTAHKFTMTADHLEEEQEKSGLGNTALGTDADVGSPIGAINEKQQAIIVIDAAGTIIVANRLAQKLFGYKKSEMEGKNVSMLMPNPFASRHNGYIRSHINSGKKRVLDIVRPVVGLHRDRTVFPMNLGVTKVSGVGGDSMFLGSIRPAQPPPGVVRVWCMPTGTVLSTDEGFFEAFGKTYKDVAGRPFPALTRDPDVILRLLDRAASACPEDFLQGKVQQPGVFVLHNYLDPVEVNIHVGMGGSETQRLLYIDMTLTQNQGMLLVTDGRGRLLYMNSEMRRTLGISDDTNIGKLDMTSLMPPPFSLLHSRWMREPGAKIPKQSCRSGATVVMSGANNTPLPIRPRITSREVDDTVQHAVRVEMSSWERGLDERQLVLTLDTRGNILRTNHAVTSLFGFRANELPGKSVSAVVDVLAQCADELEGILARMAEKASAKPGYSWRCGLHPPLTKPLTQLSPMEELVLQRSTRPAIMMLELKEIEDELPEINLHIYKADMLNAIIEVDHNGNISKPNLSPLDPTGYLFGCGIRTMFRRPLKHYIDLGGRPVDSLLKDDNVKGAMKKGTSTGTKVGPVKTLPGFHADGAPLMLNLLAVTLNGKSIVVKCSYAELERGDVSRFRSTLQSRETKSNKSRRMSAFQYHEEDVRLSAAQYQDQDIVAALEQQPVALPAQRRSGGGAMPAPAAAPKKGVKFAVEEDAAADDQDEELGSLTPSEDDEGGASEEEDLAVDEVPPAEEASEEGTSDSASQNEGQQEIATALLETDWRRGRRIKQLYSMLNNQQAKANQTRYVHHTYIMLAILVCVHTVFFAVWVHLVDTINQDAMDLESNGSLVFEINSIAIDNLKISNMYNGITDELTFQYTDEEMKITEERLSKDIKLMEDLLFGIYLGFNRLRRLRDAYNLRELWEGTPIEEESFVDVRMPHVEEEGSNLWEMGNQFLSAAREILHNHELIAEQTGKDFTKNIYWKYINDNEGPFSTYCVKSLSALLKRDIENMTETADIGWGLMIIELVVCACVIIYSYILLKGVSNVRHLLMAVFLTIPSGFLRTLAEKQVRMADEDSDGRGNEEEDEEEQLLLQQAQQAQQQPPPLPPSQKTAAGPPLPGLTGNRTSQDGGAKKGKSNVVLDVNTLPDPNHGALGEPSTRMGRLLGRAAAAWHSLCERAASLAHVKELVTEQPIAVGKKRLHRYRRDIATMLIPLMVWFVLLLVIYIVSVEDFKDLRRPMVNSYTIDRMKALFVEVTSDVFEVASVKSPEEVIELREEGSLDKRFKNLKHLYKALLYGLDQEDRWDMDFVRFDGTLFDSKETEEIFFSTEENPDCFVNYQPERYCFEKGHRFYQVTHHALDAMMLRFFDEVQLLMDDDPQAIVDRHMGGPRMDYIWNVGWYSLEGSLEAAREHYADELQQGTVKVLDAQIALFAVMWVLLAAYCYFLFFPYKHHLAHELRQVAEMLSHLPSDMNVEGNVAQAVGLDTDGSTPTNRIEGPRGK